MAADGRMAIGHDEIGQRLRAYRLGRNLTASEIADRLGISRAAVYRLEKGDLVKIETLERLSELLGVSLPSLLGVGVEYYDNAISFFERMRQFEETASFVIGNFSPISLLLLSDDYMGHLRTMLAEAVPPGQGRQRDADRVEALVHIDRVLAILDERRRTARRRATPVVSIVGTQEIERFLRIGLIGRFDLPSGVAVERRRAARAEVERLVEVFLAHPIGVQVGIVEDSPPTQTFQVFEQPDAPSAVTLSPYRLGEQPNVSSGIAMATRAPEAVRLFTDTLKRRWDRAHKGEAGARILRMLIERAAQE
jgi:transcriptional regulator with XRE-family HTH domain